MQDLNLFNMISASKQVVYLVHIVIPMVVLLILKKGFLHKLPRDRGKAFTIDGAKSKGKATGTGILLYAAFLATYLLVGDLEVKWLGLYGIMFYEMITGYLDDRASQPWHENLKALLDFMACILTAFIFNLDGGVVFDFYLFTVASTSLIGYIIILVFLWTCINTFNCCDGVDGLSGTMALNTLLALGIFMVGLGMSSVLPMMVSLISILIWYLWYNSEPSSLLMGDAGSRFIGLFLGLCFLETGHLLLAFIFAFTIIIDGFPGLVKIFIIKVFKKNIMPMRFPLHDYMRKDLGWGKSKIVFRFLLIQATISGVGLIVLSMF